MRRPRTRGQRERKVDLLILRRPGESFGEEEGLVSAEDSLRASGSHREQPVKHRVLKEESRDSTKF